ncbi:unnamed protein product [Scytosiphon promiscuus]
MRSSVRKNGKNADRPGCRTAKEAAVDSILVTAPVEAPAAQSGNSALWDRRMRIASCASFFMGCVWILLFPLVTVTTGETKPRGTFFDENALLVHHTSTKLAAAHVDWAKPSQLSKAYPPQDGTAGSEWVCTVLRGMDLPCYVHTFYESPKVRSGLRKSVYTVLDPAPGSDGKECVVLTTTQNLSGAAQGMLDQPAFMGLSLALSALRHLKENVGWMSKSLLVLVADDDLDGAERLDLGIKAFIDDYHVDTLDLLGRRTRDANMTSSIRHCGVMRAALSLEYAEAGDPEVVQLLTSGVNGELPNMDLLNAAVFHHERQGLAVKLDMCSTPLNGEPFACPDAVGQAAKAAELYLPPSAKTSAVQGYLDRLFAMLGFMGSAVVGPNGPHAHFLRHSVDALTIRSLGKTKRDQSNIGQRATTSGTATGSTAAVLSILRGVSNLEEELHHSFFSYLMLSTKAFVSIGEYAYALVLLLIPLALQGRRLSALKEGGSLVSAVLIVAAFQIFGAVLLCAAYAWPEPSAKALGVHIKVADIVGYMVVFGVRACVPRESSNQKRLPAWVGSKTVMACVLGYSCTVTALLSWHVAAILALIHVPLLVAVRPFQRKSLSSWCMALGMIISSPAQWSSILGWAMAHASGTSVMLRWLQLFRLSGLLNLPLMCLVSMPTHLTIAFVLLS